MATGSPERVLMDDAFPIHAETAVHPDILHEGLLITFPVDAQTHVNMFRKLELRRGSVETIFIPDDRRKPIVGHSLRMYAHNGAHDEKATIRELGGNNFWQPPTTDLHTKVTPWVIKLGGHQAAYTQYDHATRVLHYVLTNHEKPFAVRVIPGETCTFFVDIKRDTIPVTIKDFSFDNATQRPLRNPSAMVILPSDNTYRMTPELSFLRWTYQGSPVCTFTYLTPPGGPKR